MKKINYAKRHESAFRESCKKIPNLICERLVDTMNFKKNVKQPSDFLCFKEPNLFYVECKTTKESELKMANISHHQFTTMLERSKIQGCECGILVEFRIDEETIKVFYIDISYINTAKNRQGKKYIDIQEASQVGIEIPTRKKKINYHYDLTPIFQ
jgi:recombination protein U